ncbi:MAG: nucleotidyltransferase family protein [Lachnospiraceae bacterium]|nr:nucleotidyltransferase family protein [Lachnospiraceae bacterium]
MSDNKELLYLAACAINGIKPDEYIYAKENSEILFKTARRHGIAALVAYALEKNEYKGIDLTTASAFRTEKDKSVRKIMLFDVERKVILDFFEKEGIRYLPLKGIILQELYPEYGMRQMADNDILYDVKGQKKLKDFMVSRGFTAKGVGVGVHDCYYKEPVYNFEMHTKLFDQSLHGGVIGDYYADVWDWAMPDEGKRFGYHMKYEDFYIYVLAHAGKHHNGSGTGIRTLVDILVMDRAFKTFDRSYVETELDKLGIKTLEEKLHNLSVKLLSDPDKTYDAFNGLTDDERQEMDYILSSGTYGTLENGVKNRMIKEIGVGPVTKKVRLKYYFKRIFPNQETMVPYFPPAKYKPLIPFVWIFRILRGMTTRRKKALNEFKIVEKQKEL